MTATTAEQQSPTPADAASAAGRIECLRGLQRRMLEAIAADRVKTDGIRAVVDVIRQYAEPEAMFYYERDEDGRLTGGVQLHPEQADDRSVRFAKQLRAVCEAACKSGEFCVRPQAAPARVILAAPVALRDGDPEAFGAIFPATASAELLVMLVQMAVSHFVTWHVLRQSRDSEAEARDAAAVLELLEEVENAPGLRHACYVLVNELQEHLHCRRVAVGIRGSGKGRCRLWAVSGVARFDKRSSSAQAIEAAMDEAILRDEVTVWPPADEEQRHGALAHKNLCSLEDVPCALGTPLRDQEGKALGALLVLDDQPDRLASRAAPFLAAAERPVATSLRVMRRIEGGAAGRLGRAAGQLWRTWKGKAALALALLLLGAMAVPLPYKVSCDCRLEPVTRRFVAAPFEGTLEKSFVKPGDIVSEGELLARLDGREIRWKRAGVVADRDQAAKQRDSAMAAHDYAEAQIARLEMERLDLELKLLDHRTENLDVKSPVPGIVTDGDLERAEGAPLTIGQTLFEIAPLEKMIVEVAVADEEVSYIRPGQPLAVWLDAYPGKTWELKLAKVQPRSEIRDQQNVFVAEASVDNVDGLLRPGMKGRAKIVTPRRWLGWILFHTPWEYLVKKFR